MGLQDIARFPVNIELFAPANADKPILYRVPDGCNIVVKGGHAIASKAIVAHGTNYVSLKLLNLGTAGAGTAQIGAAIGGTAGWAAGVAKSFEAADFTAKAGEVIACEVTVGGSVTIGQMQVQLDIVF
jgi:hypothetical protein